MIITAVIFAVPIDIIPRQNPKYLINGNHMFGYYHSSSKFAVPIDIIPRQNKKSPINGNHMFGYYH
jgi:hypothetical protein